MYDSIVNAIKWLWDYIWDIFSSVLDFFVAVYEILVNVSSFIISAIGFIWFAWKTLVVWVAKLLWSVIDGGVFVNVNRAFVYISDFIWWPATIFLSALLLIIIIRIIVSFVFKILRLNTDYTMYKTQWKDNSTSQKISDFQKKYKDW